MGDVERAREYVKRHFPDVSSNEREKLLKKHKYRHYDVAAELKARRHIARGDTAPTPPLSPNTSASREDGYASDLDSSERPGYGDNEEAERNLCNVCLHALATTRVKNMSTGGTIAVCADCLPPAPPVPKAPASDPLIDGQGRRRSSSVSAITPMASTMPIRPSKMPSMKDTLTVPLLDLANVPDDAAAAASRSTSGSRSARAEKPRPAFTSSQSTHVTPNVDTRPRAATATRSLRAGAVPPLWFDDRAKHDEDGGEKALMSARSRRVVSKLWTEHEAAQAPARRIKKALTREISAYRHIVDRQLAIAELHEQLNRRQLQLHRMIQKGGRSLSTDEVGVMATEIVEDYEEQQELEMKHRQLGAKLPAILTNMHVVATDARLVATAMEEKARTVRTKILYDDLMECADVLRSLTRVAFMFIKSKENRKERPLQSLAYDGGPRGVPPSEAPAVSVDRRRTLSPRSFSSRPTVARTLDIPGGGKSERRALSPRGTPTASSTSTRAQALSTSGTMKRSSNAPTISLSKSARAKPPREEIFVEHNDVERLIGRRPSNNGYDAHASIYEDLDDASQSSYRSAVDKAEVRAKAKKGKNTKRTYADVHAELKAAKRTAKGLRYALDATEEKDAVLVVRYEAARQRVKELEIEKLQMT